MNLLTALWLAHAVWWMLSRALNVGVMVHNSVHSTSIVALSEPSLTWLVVHFVVSAIIQFAGHPLMMGWWRE